MDDTSRLEESIAQRWPCILIAEASLVQFISSNRRGALLYSSSKMHTIFGSLRSVNSARECCRALRSVLRESASYHDQLLPIVVVTIVLWLRTCMQEASNPQHNLQTQLTIYLQIDNRDASIACRFAITTYECRQNVNLQ